MNLMKNKEEYNHKPKVKSFKNLSLVRLSLWADSSKLSEPFLFEIGPIS